GEDDNHPFTAVTSGSFYAAFLVNVVSAQATGDYFFHLFDGAISANGFYGRVFVKSVTGGYQYGLQFKSGTGGTCTVYKSTVYTTGTTHLVVVKYIFVSGAANDQVALFVDPAVSCSEPSPDVTVTDQGAGACGAVLPSDFDFTNIDGVASRQGSGTAAPSVQVDGIRAADNWQDLVGATAATTTTDLTQDPAKTNCGEKVV